MTPPVSADTSPLPAGDDGFADVLHDIIATGAVQPVFQPIYSRIHGDVVAYEALARGPQGSPLETPHQLFGAAAAAGRTGDLDDLCRARALEVALKTIDDRFMLFLNVGPGQVGREPSARLAEAIAASSGRLRVALELAERDLFDHPAALLQLVADTRRQGWAVALDDVGVNPQSLSLLEFCEPDFVKLDRSLISGPVSVQTGLVLSAVSDHAERRQTAIVAEGIENGADFQRADAWRADLLQGFGLARPGPIPDLPTPTAPLELTPHASGRNSGSPYELVADHPRLTTAGRELLIAVSIDFENQAARLSDAPVLLAAFQNDFHLGPATARRYVDIAANAAFVGVLGQGMSTEPVPGVRGGDLDAHDPLAREWTVVVLSPHFAGALIAREIEPDRNGDRSFRYAITHDRTIVCEAARRLAYRLD